ncbi:MAG: PadR family transcriptional regulator [Actinobacteria bacterium]|nr:PadR family transcriptional regulator [Actinomycetota bacterium]
MPRSPDVDPGRFAEPSLLILTSLADGPRHGYALIKDVEEFAGVTLGPGTLYGALARLERQGLIRPLAAEDRRRPYELTDAGAAALRPRLASMRKVADVGLRRLAPSTSPAAA